LKLSFIQNKYATSHHMVIKPFLLLGLAAADVINIAADHQKFITLTGELSCQRLRRSAVPDIWLCPPKFKWFT